MFTVFLRCFSSGERSATGCRIDVGEIIYKPPRDGPTLWEIGIPDRSAAEFYIPDTNPKYLNKIFVNHPEK